MATLYTDAGGRHVPRSEYTGNKGKTTSRTLKLKSERLSKVFYISRALDTGIKRDVREAIEDNLNERNQSIDVTSDRSRNLVKIFIPEAIDARRKELRGTDSYVNIKSVVAQVISDNADKVENTQVSELI